MIFELFANLFVMVAIAAIYVFIISFTVWMIVDAAKQDKFWWLVLIIGVPLVGAVIYFFVEKKGDYAKIAPAHHEHKSE